MIKHNNFYIKNLKSVVFLGESKTLESLQRINKSLGLKTIIITSPHQAKLIDKKINVNIFTNLDNKFKKLIKKNVNIENTLFVSLGARYIFKKETINNFFLNNLINFHNTRLPLDAGGGGFSWNILREDRINNQLVHIVDEGIDTGSIIDTEKNLFPVNCVIPSDFKKYSALKFVSFYKKFILNIKKNKEFRLKPQLDYFGRYNPRLNTSINGFINWDLDSHDLVNFINAFDDPYTGALTYLNNKKFGRLSIKKVQLHGGDSSNHPYMSGIVTRHDKDWIVVSTRGKHMLLIEEVLDANKKNIISEIKVGDRFYTKLKNLEDGKSKRIIYNSKGIK